MKKTFMLLVALGLTVTGLFAADTALVDNAVPVKILTVGNSFSNNSCKYLPDMFKDSGVNVLLDRSGALGGHSLSRHLAYAEKWEVDPNDPAGRPYSTEIDGKKVKVGLQDLLKKEAWNFITIQQVSHQSPDLATYEPAEKLVAIIKKYAPQAEIVMHETWSYRADSPWLKKNNMTEREMYEKLHAAYQATAAKLGLRVIPVGTAFQAALQSPEWGCKLDESCDPAKLVHPNLPKDYRSLQVGYYWKKDKDGAWTLGCDPNHASKYGEYLGGAVWYEFFLGGVEGNSFVPAGVGDDETAILQNIAAETVRKAANLRERELLRK
jgi:hypothetical protein